MTAANRFLLEHFEKLILLFVFVSVAVGFSVDDAPKLDLAAVDRDVAVVEAHMRRPSAGPPAPARPLTGLQARLAGAPEVQPFPKWLPYRRPGVLTEERSWKDVTGTHAAAELQSVLKGRDAIALSWKEPRASEFLAVTRVLQVSVNEGPWETLLEPAAGTRSHVHEGLKTRSSYRYRLLSAAAIDPVSARQARARRERLLLPKDELERTSAVTGAIRIASNVFVIPNSVWPERPLEGTPAKAYVIVWIRNEEGELRKRGFQVEVGQAIGEVVENGRKRIDFRSGASLVSAKERVEEHADGRRVRIGVIQVRWEDGFVESIESTAQPPR